jgi:hypothetical protein
LLARKCAAPDRRLSPPTQARSGPRNGSLGQDSGAVSAGAESGDRAGRAESLSHSPRGPPPDLRRASAKSRRRHAPPGRWTTPQRISRATFIPASATCTCPRCGRRRWVGLSNLEVTQAASGWLTVRACLKIGRNPATRIFEACPGGEAGASPQWAVTVEPTPAGIKRTVVRRVFAEGALWLGCSAVAERCRVAGSSGRPTRSAKTGALRILRQVLNEPGRGRHPASRLVSRNAGADRSAMEDACRQADRRLDTPVHFTLSTSFTFATLRNRPKGEHLPDRCCP